MAIRAISNKFVGIKPSANRPGLRSYGVTKRKVLPVNVSALTAQQVAMAMSAYVQPSPALPGAGQPAVPTQPTTWEYYISPRLYEYNIYY